MNLSALFKTQILLVTVVAFILCALRRGDVAPFLAGAALVTVNFILLTTVWRRILDKKSVAMTFALVVIKYAILGALLYIFVKQWNLAVIPLFVGLSSIVGSIVVSAVATCKTESE